MIFRKGSVFKNENMSICGSAKRIIAMLSVIAASILFYGAVPSSKADSPITSVTIIDGEHHFEVETKGPSVGDALNVAKITLNENDRISKNLSAKITDGDIITIVRQKTFYLNTSGKTFEIHTCEETVGQALLADGFQVGKYDEVVPHVNTPVTDGLHVSVARVYVDVYEVAEEIPFSSKTVNNNKKPIGYNAVIQEGKPGVTVRTYKKVTKEDAGVTVTLIGENEESKPIEQITEIGTMKAPEQPKTTSSATSEKTTSKKTTSEKTPENTTSVHVTPGKTSDGIPHSALPAMSQNNTVTTRNGNTAVTAYGTFTFSKVINCKATAYEGSSASNGKWAGQTATGRAPVYGVVAVDPKVIPLNSKLYIESADGGKSWIYGFAVAGDTGGAIKGNRIDLCYNTLNQCYQFGRRDAVVYILD